jgi:DNA-binding transcriptional LysR family regulator
MKISSLNLEAFYATARLRSFSRAAESLAVTQSALSQRIQKLEGELEATLFIRETGGPELTPAGEALLRHCQITESLESEVLAHFKPSVKGLAGSVRIAGYSSVLRSVIMPSVAPLLRTHPNLQADFKNFEMNELWEALRSGEADFAVLDYRLGRAGLREEKLGTEEYVVIEGSKGSPEDLYLDHNPEDTATELFFNSQTQKPKNYRRSFMGDVYGIISGVELGLGRAVMSRHLIESNSKVRVLKNFKRHTREVWLHYFEQPYYSKLHQETARHLQENARRFLKD